MIRPFRLRFAASSRVFATILLAMVAAGAACSSGESRGQRSGNENSAEDQTPPIAIAVSRTESRNVPAYIQATGSLMADETSDIAPRIAGKVANVSANVGQFITQGAAIAKIDDSDARRELAGAQARVKQAVAGVRQAEARLGLEPNGRFNASIIPEVRSAGAAYEQAVAELKQAEANEKRYRELVETGDVSMIAYETYR